MHAFVFGVCSSCALVNNLEVCTVGFPRALIFVFGVSAYFVVPCGLRARLPISLFHKNKVVPISFIFWTMWVGVCVFCQPLGTLRDTRASKGA